MALNLNKDLIFNFDNNGEILSGGYKINNYFMSNNKSPFINIEEEEVPCDDDDNKHELNKDKQEVSKLFSNYTIPIGLFYFNNPTKIKNLVENINYSHDTLTDDIYDNLVKLASISPINSPKKETLKINHNELKFNKKNKTNYKNKKNKQNKTKYKKDKKY
jgi:hypothetical protein